MKIIHIDCTAGLSGGALLGAMADLGAKPELPAEQMKSILPVPFQITFEKKHLGGSTATATVLKVDTGQKLVPASFTVNSMTGKLPAGDKPGDKLISFFDRYIQAMARVSGTPALEIVMPEAEIYRMIIIAACFFAAADQLDLKRITASPIPAGFHLASDNSAPLLLELARGAVIKQYQERSVPVTAFGTALLTSLSEEYGPLPEIVLANTGYGIAGGHLQDKALVRIISGTIRDRETLGAGRDTITVVETAIDDMNPEFFPFLIERLLAGGALDAYLTPIYMKKGRPAHLLTILCARPNLEDSLNIIFKETTTLGARIREEGRRTLSRYFIKVRTPYGEVAVKTGCITEGGTPVQYAPEFEDCKKLALELNVPVKEVYAAAQKAACEYIKIK